MRLVAYWWVNQGSTWRHEIPGEYLWAPKVDKRGRRQVFWDNMTLLEPGDIVFSYFGSALQYAGVVVSGAVTDRKPDFGAPGSAWAEDGWSAEMRYVKLPVAVRPQDHLAFYEQVVPEKYAPMNRKGVVNTKYLFSVPNALGEFYLRVGGVSALEVEAVARFDPSVDVVLEEAEEVLSNPALTATERHVLARARLGQGIFKDEVSRIEPACRLTGVTDRQHLIASHMKPWRASDNAERLDGYNGLLLSPHVDNLFDRGLITFRQNGDVLVSPHLNPEVPIKWKLDLNHQGRRFNGGQLPYLEYHRDLIFRS